MSETQIPAAIIATPPNRVTPEDIADLARRMNEIIKTHPRYVAGNRVVPAPSSDPSASIWENVAYVNAKGGTAKDQTPFVWVLMKLMRRESPPV